MAKPGHQKTDQPHQGQSLTGQISVFLADGMILSWRDLTGE
jgi:hypothetical protein